MSEWYGQIPEGWSSRRLSWVFGVISSGTTPPSAMLVRDYFGGPIPWVTTGELRERIINSTQQSVTQEALDHFPALKVFPAGSLVIAMYGATIGRLGILGIDASTNQACCVFSNPGFNVTRYFYYVLSAAKSHLLMLADGGGQPNINQEKLRSLRVPFPPPNVQKVIADFLDRETAEIDAFIADQERLIELLTERRTATITHAVTKGLDPSAPMRDSGIPWLGQIPAHWRLVPVKALAKLERGAFKHRPRNAPHLYDGPYPFVQTGSVARNAGRIITEYSQTLTDAGLKTSKKFPAGSLLMAIAANIGDIAVLGFDACAPDSLLALIPSEDIYPWYLVHLITAAKPELTRLAPVSTQGNLNVEIVGAVKVPLPPEQEQRELLDHLQSELDHFDSMISDAKRAIELSKERRAALISAAVTGQIDVRTHA